METFSFPYPPYSIQLDLMNKLNECLEQRKTGIFESPTGTGKSLSVLCATLSWLERQDREEEERLKQIIEKKDEDDEGKDWVAAYAKKKQQNILKEEAREELEKRNKIKERIKAAEDGKKKERVREKREKENNDGEEDECIIEVNEDTEPDPEKDEEEKQSCVKILYASRTHSQLQQILDESAKTRFRPRVVSLASRSLLCANEDVTSLKTTHLINERCMELRKKTNEPKREPGKKAPRLALSSCQYYKAEAIEDLTDSILACRVTDANSVLEEGKATLACPYFASRRAIPLAQLVLLPYQVLLHEKTRESWGIELENNVVIIDEAHNVIQTIGSLYSVELSLTTLTSALALLRQYADQYRLRLSARNLCSVRQLIVVISALESYLRNAKTSGPITLQTLVLELELLEVSLFSLVEYMEKVDLCRKMHGFHLRAMKGTVLKEKQRNSGVASLLAKKGSIEEEKKDTVPPPPSTPHASPLFPVKSFLDSLLTPFDDGRILVDVEAKTLKFVLLNPAARLSSLVAQTRCTLLVGGTMEPAELLVSSLQGEGDLKREITRFSCSHVVPEENVLAMVVGNGVDGKRLELRLENRGREDVLASLSRTLHSLISTSPNGIVVFFPSYSFLEVFTKHIGNNGIKAKIEYSFVCSRSPTSGHLFPYSRSLFVERRGSTDMKGLLEGYSRAAKSKRGALLLAVMGGRLSEGINFNDEMGRMVIVVGLPYANRGSIELRERMRFMDGQQQGRGAQLYESMCWHAVNQAVGRALRHRNDWASIVLLDARFTSAGPGKISSWLAPRIKRPSNFGEVLEKLNEFYSVKKEKLRY